MGKVTKEVLSNDTGKDIVKAIDKLKDTVVAANSAKYDEESTLLEVTDARAEFTSLGQRLNVKPYYFDSVADMKLAKLKSGDCVITLGYYEANDGGAGIYKIVNDDLIDDGGSAHELNNGLFAKLIIENDTINVKQFGAKGDGITDDTIYIQTALKFKENKYLKLVFNQNETYLVNGYIYLYSNTDIELNNCTIKASARTLFLNNIDSVSVAGYGALKNISINNGTFDGSALGIIFPLIHAENINISNIKFLDCSLASHIFDLGGCKNINFYNCNFTGSYINESLANKYYNELIQLDYANQTAVPYWGSSEEFAFDDLPTINVTIDHCNFEIGNGNHYPNAIGSHAVHGTKAIKNIKIINNTFNDFSYHNIRLPRAQDVLIDNNKFYNSTIVTRSGYSGSKIMLSMIIKNYENEEFTKNIIISNNSFYNDIDTNIMCDIYLLGNTNHLLNEINVNNNYVIGSGNSGADFFQIGNSNNISVKNNTIKNIKNVAYKLSDTSIGIIDISNNNIIDCRDTYKTNLSDNNPDPTLNVYNDNNIIVGNDGFNTGNFAVVLETGSDATGPLIDDRLPLTKTSGSDLFYVNDGKECYIPTSIRKVKISGSISLTNNQTTDQSYQLKVRQNNSSTGNVNLVTLNYFIPAGKTINLIIPDIVCDVDTWVVYRNRIFFTLAINSGDIIHSNATKIFIKSV